MKNYYQSSEQPQAIKDIGKQVFRLVAPNFNPLLSLLMDCIRGIRSHRQEMVHKRDRIAEEGLAAAVRLMQPDDQMSHSQNKSYFKRIEGTKK